MARRFSISDMGLGLIEALGLSYAWSMEDPINPDGKEISGIKPEVIDNYFYHYQFNTADELLSAIDTQRSEILRSKNYNETHTFLFRGHREHDWKLIPSLFRSFDLLTLYRGRYEAGDGPELQMFLQFIKSINNQGLSIGGADRELQAVDYYDFGRKYGSIPDINLFNQFPTEDQLPILGLAQHYGVPTRLLDFSKNPYKALFFATKSLYPFYDPDSESEKRIGLWLFSELQIYVASLFSHISRVDIPKFQNKNIIAQEGVFLHYIPPRIEDGFPSGDTKFFNQDKAYTDIKPLHEVIVDVMRDQRWISVDTVSSDESDFLVKIMNEVTGLPMLFSLPHTESFEINRKLDQLNINFSTMMPNLEGAAQEALRRVRSS